MLDHSLGFSPIFTFLTKCDKQNKKSMPPERIELSTPGLQDQCSATEL